MARISSRMREVIRRCKADPIFFIKNFVKIRHPMAGIIPFNPWAYQIRSIKLFRKHRYNCYLKCRQCGVSTLAGGYSLWLSMFHPHATVLVTSKRDEDAKDFLRKNVNIPYSYLPKSFKNIWGDPPPIDSAHTMMFRNGSTIKSLTSGPETLRTNSSTLNIIDEAAFTPNMDEMWTGGQPTLVHGGSVIVISTPKGKGNWYHSTWESAIAGENEFNPIEIKWWEMDWKIEYVNKQTGQIESVEPARGIRECNEEERRTYGPYWSPWLEEQYRSLQEKGETHKFQQEYLGEFVSSGNTVVDPQVLLHIEKTRADNFSVMDEAVYHHPMTEQELVLDFQKQLFVWKRPVRPTPDVIEHGKIIIPGEPGHTYCLGSDVSTGEATDYSAIEIIDITAKEQVAELKIKAPPSVLTMMIDFLARWYNNALAVVERTGIGAAVAIDIEQQIGYYNVYKQKMPGGKRSKKAGFPTSGVSKAHLNKCLMDMLGEDGFKIYSHRLYRELGMYVYHTPIKTGAEPGPGNNDDLVIAMALALIGVQDAIMMSSTSLIPVRGGDGTSIPILQKPAESRKEVMEKYSKFAAKGGANFLMPMQHTHDMPNEQQSAEAMLYEFTKQLGGLTKEQLASRTPGVVSRKHVVQRKS